LVKPATPAGPSQRGQEQRANKRAMASPKVSPMQTMAVQVHAAGESNVLGDGITSIVNYRVMNICLLLCRHNLLA